MTTNSTIASFEPLKVLFQEGLHPPFFITFETHIDDQQRNIFIEQFVQNVASANSIHRNQLEISEYKEGGFDKDSNATVLNISCLEKNLFDNFMSTKEVSNSINYTITASPYKMESPSERPLKHHSLILEKIINPQGVEMEVDENIIKTDHYLFNTGNLYLECDEQEKQETPYTYSSKISATILSFLPYNEEPRPKCPVPLNLSAELVNSVKGVSKEECLSGLERTNGGELKCVDKVVLDSQKGLISELIKLLAKSIAEGRGVVGVSLPVRIFEPRSLIERIIDWWSYGPIFLKAAANKSSVIDRIKLIVTYSIAGMHAGVSLYKPFNPLLGETYQGIFEDGTIINCEHISHHPPISYFIIQGEGYRVSGYYEFFAKTNFNYNEITMYTLGDTTIEFDDGMKFILRLPAAKLKGMMFGDKATKFSGALSVFNEKAGIKAVCGIGYELKTAKISKSNKSDNVAGMIYEYDKGATVMNVNNKNADDYYDKEVKMKDCVKVISTFSGNWLESMEFNGEKLWDIDSQRPMKHFSIQNPLPSDCRFREDLIWLRYGEKKIAQKWKFELEKQQRLEKKIREKAEKDSKKK